MLIKPPPSRELQPTCHHPQFHGRVNQRSQQHAGVQGAGGGGGQGASLGKALWAAGYGRCKLKARASIRAHHCPMLHCRACRTYASRHSPAEPCLPAITRSWTLCKRQQLQSLTSVAHKKPRSAHLESQLGDGHDPQVSGAGQACQQEGGLAVRVAPEVVQRKLQ